MHGRDHRHSLRTWTDLWFPKHVVLKMPHLRDEPQTQTLDQPPATGASEGLTAALSDELLLRVLAALPDSSRGPASLVCRRWLRLLGRLRRRLVLLRWPFLARGRLLLRFPDLADLDLLPASFDASFDAPRVPLLTRGPISIRLDPLADPLLGDCRFLPSETIDRGLEALGRGLSGLRKLSLVAAAASESGLMALAAGCPTLQELELHRCTDSALRPISAFENLQILKLVGSVEGLYRGPGVTDIGLTILAHGCKRLVKLELCGCEGSYDGISAIGRCCLMLEELTIADHWMDAGWMAALSFCGNLKTLKLLSCKTIDSDPGPVEHLGSCPTIERLQMQRCQLRDRRSLHALFVVCEAVREIVFQDCWGLDNDMFSTAAFCRRVKLLSLEGCSLLTTEGLETVILSWKELQSLLVVSCNNIRDNEVSPTLSSLFSILKELKWRPDTKSVLALSLADTGMGKKGGRFFKRRVLRGRQRSMGTPDEGL